MDLTLAKWVLFLLVTFCLSVCTTRSNDNSRTTVSINTPNNSDSNMLTSTVKSQRTAASVVSTSPSGSYSTQSTESFSSLVSTTQPPSTSLTTIVSTSTKSPVGSNSFNASPSSFTVTIQSSHGSSEDNNDTLVIVLAVLFGVAGIVAILALLLYFRTSHSCYDRLRRMRGTQSSDAFEFDTVHGNPSSSTPFRTRLASLSSMRRQAICKSEPFSIMDYRDHVKRLHADSDYLFSLEYEAVGNRKYLTDADKKLELTSHEGKKLNNKAKNRYTDILPYDHSRVVLSEIEDEPDSVYINANYVDSYRQSHAYIAAQGPLPASLDDFWRLIWESDTRVIVMATNLFERTKSKCVQYWPNNGSCSYGFLRVSLVKEEMFANYVIRTLSVEPLPNQTHYTEMKSESEPRVIQQFQFTEWPDHDVPVHPVALLRYIRHSKSANPPDAGPMVVHCSAGVGRSGAYIVIDSMMERIEDDKTVDIFNFLNHIRTQRVYLVQEESQYVFVHDCILEFINFGDTNIPIRAFHKRLEALRKVNPDSKKSRLREEYEDIDKTKHPEKHKWAGKKNCNLPKNRCKDILPVERTRVKLPPVLGIDGGDYINASFIDGFRKKREYIATQAPMVRTAECFYRMICSTNCSIIVMLLDDEQWKKDDYADLPTEDEAVTCGRFEIHLESQEVAEEVTVRKLRLFSSETSDGHTVIHYHYRDWPSDGFPKDKTSLINFIEQVRDHKMAERSEHPITVHCDYGVGPTGVFCLVSSLYDQIEREQCVDVFHAAKLLRVQRPKLIKTLEQYSFCYEVLDQIIARKLISMTTDSESDEAYNNPNDRANYRSGMNGSVVTDTSASDSGKGSPKAVAERPSAGNVEPSAGNASQTESKADENVGKSPRQGGKNKGTGNDSSRGDSRNSSNDSGSAVAANGSRYSLGISDKEQEDKSTSSQPRRRKR